MAAHPLLKIKSTEVRSYQISLENCLRKRDWYGLPHFSQRKRCGNAKRRPYFALTCFPSKPPSGNATETWTTRFPQDFRNTETPYFTLWSYMRQLRKYSSISWSWKSPEKDLKTLQLVKSEWSPPLEWLPVLSVSTKLRIDLTKYSCVQSDVQFSTSVVNKPWTYSFVVRLHEHVLTFPVKQVS